jgi:transcriptional regulator with XRE-family HTH domain
MRGNNMFLSPEEKLLALRKKYKITQGELVGKDITRVFLGMIEIGKRSLTEKTAKILCKNLHNILLSKGIKENISLTELMKTKEEQAIEFLNNMLLSEIDISNENLWIIEEALYELKPKEREEFCEKLYIRFKTRKRYALARDYLLKSFHGVRKIKDLRTKLIDMFHICEELQDPQGAIYIYKKFCNNLDRNKTEEKYDVLTYSYARALVEVESYDLALEIAKQLLKKSKDDDSIYIFRNLIAEIYRKQKRDEDSIKEYTSLVKGKEAIHKCLGYGEIIKIAIDENNRDLIKKYYEKCKSNFSEHFEYNYELLDILCTLAKGATALGKLKDAKSHYMEALVVAHSLENIDHKKIEIISDLLDIVDKSDFYSVQSIEKEYLELLKTTHNYEPALKFLKYYEKFLPNELGNKFELFLQK